MKVHTWLVAASLIALAGVPMGSTVPGSPGTVVAQGTQPTTPPAAQPSTPTTPKPTSTPGRIRPKPGEKPKPNNPVDSPPATTPGGTPATKPGAAAPAAVEPPLTTLPLATEPGPYLIRDLDRAKNWTFTARIEVQGSTYDDVVSDPHGGSARMPGHDEWKFQTLAVVFPILKSTASSDVIQDSWQGKLRVNDQVVDDKIESADLIDNGHSGTRLVKFTAVNGTARAVDLEISYNMVCYRTKLDEAAAMKVEWPKGGWPADAASTFKPQMYIDYAPDIEHDGQLRPYDTEPLQNLLNSWLQAERVSSPRDIPLVRVAKIITGGVVKDLQPSGNGISYNRRGQLEGIEIKPIPTTIADKKGTEFDIVCVYVAALRRAGIPARMVIGWQKEESGDDDKFLDRNKGVARMRAWAEFALFDENFKSGANAQACMNWIPVDVVSLRKSSSRPPPLDRAWRFFGTVEDLEGTAPFSFHLHPPTTVRAYGSPGFWGWWMTPENPPRAMQNLLITVTRTAVKASDKDKDKKEKEEENRNRRNQQRKKN